MQPHLKRAFIILILVIIGFLFVRSFIVPGSFGQYGWYRGDSVAELRELPVGYAGSASCSDVNCHNSVYTIWVNSSHKTVNCETCHGPSQNHVTDTRTMPTPANDTREFCGMCHFKRTARPADFPQIDPDTHGENLQCTYCHNPHKPWFL
ncbi:Uncharacterised protein [uncultured archaeon]|nr:Uncharacterised protein [uncultured archaeon]